MTEDYLHYLWKLSKFNSSDLKDAEGNPLIILKNGFHNHNAGPDFKEGKVQIGETVWFGSIEIHIRSSDWNRHKHQYDSQYDNVVLHVVYEHDKEIVNSKGGSIPVLELKSYISEQAYFDYENFLNSGNAISCNSQLDQVPSFVVSGQLDAMISDRLEMKWRSIRKTLEENSGDWADTFHQFLFRFMGMKVNGDAMQELASRLSLKLLSKEQHNALTIEAMIFGQAGMLNEIIEGDEYHSKLRNEYLFLKQKYGLKSMEITNWNFGRLRPPNFPTVRIAQLASLYQNSINLFDSIRSKIPIEDYSILFDVDANQYWQNKYRFGVVSKRSQPKIVGKTTIQNLKINLVAPFAYAYGKNIGDETYIDYARDILRTCNFENISRLKKFNELPMLFNSAFDSQSLLQLDDQFCAKKRCLNCKIGVFLLR